eukprot:6887529-Pyramimonas_sp.AAC.1
MGSSLIPWGFVATYSVAVGNAFDELKEQDESFNWLETTIPDRDDETFDIGAAVFVDDVTRITPIPKHATGNDIVRKLNRTTRTINTEIGKQGGGLNEDKTVSTLDLRGHGSNTATGKVAASRQLKGAVAKCARLLGPIVAAD